MDSTEVMLLLVTMMGVGIVISALMLRYKRQELRHRERMAALEKGLDLSALPGAFDMPGAPMSGVPWTPRIYLLRGMIWLFTGIGLSIFLFNLAFSTRHLGGPADLGATLFEVQRLRNMGVPEDQLKELLEQSKHNPRPTQRIPDGVGFLGFVPIGVGLAYLIFYALEGRKMKVLPGSGAEQSSIGNSTKHPNAP